MIAGRLHWNARGAKGKSRAELAAFAFPHGTPDAHRSGIQAACVAVTSFAASAGLAGVRPRRTRGARGDARRVCRAPPRRKSHGEAVTHRSTPVQRHRQRLLGRDTPSRATFADQAHRASQRRRDRDALRLGASDSDGMDGSTARRGGRRVSRKSDGVPSRRWRCTAGIGLPCPVCAAPVQRISYADNETNYCARCQTDGKLLADRGLSRLLKQDWPRSLDEIL